LNKYRVESQTKQMYTDLMNARVQAMKRNRTFFVVFNPTPPTSAATKYTIYEDTSPTPDGNGTLEPANDTKVLQTSLNAKYALTIPGDAANSINFDPKGLASMLPGAAGLPQTIYVTARFNAAYDCILIEPIRITMGAWNGANCVVQ
jgi:Tfp pilus assembly protein FimT